MFKLFISKFLSTFKMLDNSIVSKADIFSGIPIKSYDDLLETKTFPFLSKIKPLSGNNVCSKTALLSERNLYEESIIWRLTNLKIKIIETSIAINGKK